MRKLRRKNFQRAVMLVVVLIIAVTALIVLTPKEAMAFDACDTAAEQNYRNPVYNMLCWIDIMFEYLFMGGGGGV